MCILCMVCLYSSICTSLRDICGTDHITYRISPILFRASSLQEGRPIYGFDYDGRRSLAWRTRRMVRFRSCDLPPR